MQLLGLAPSVTLKITLNEIEGRKKASLKDKSGNSRKIPVFTDGEDITGKVQVQMNKTKKLEHQGIKIELVGQIEMFYEKTGTSDFVSLSRDLEPPGVLTDDVSFDFSFNKVEKQFESYNGIGCRLRYLVRATIMRSYGKVTKEEELMVYNVTDEPELNTSIKMEVGIEECLHIEFEYNRGKYHMKDCVIGKVYFLLVRIKIKHMELAIIKRETLGAGNNAQTESETIAKYEVMDGAPVRGECIPIRLFLSAFDLTPTYKNVNNRFSVRYYLNLVLIDEEDRRYFKQQEITLWRKKF